MQATYVILTFLVAIYLKGKIKITNTFCLTNISKILFQMWSILKISRHFTFFFCTKSVKLGMHSVLAAHLHLERPQVQGSACGRDSVLNRAAWNCAVEAFLRRSTVLVVALVFQITFSMGKKKHREKLTFERYPEPHFSNTGHSGCVCFPDTVLGPQYVQGKLSKEWGLYQQLLHLVY